MNTQAKELLEKLKAAIAAGSRVDLLTAELVIALTESTPAPTAPAEAPKQG